MFTRFMTTWSTGRLLWKRKGGCWGKRKEKRQARTSCWCYCLGGYLKCSLWALLTGSAPNVSLQCTCIAHTLSRHIFRYDAGFNLIVTIDTVSLTPPFLADLNQITSILLLQHWLKGYNIIALLFSPNCWILTLNVTTLPCLLHQICSRCKRISLGLSLKVMSGFYVVVLLVCGWP